MGQEKTSPLAENTFPLSLSQNEVWLDQRAWPESPHLNVGGCGLLNGYVDIDRLDRALQLIVSENESLRLVPLANGQQKLLTNANRSLDVVDLRNEEDPLKAMDAWWREQMASAFPFDESVLWRITLLLVGHDRYGLSVRFHHIIMDGWGTSLFTKRWSDLYNSDDLIVDASPPRGASYLDYISESVKYRTSEAFLRDEAFWQNEMPTLPDNLFTKKYPSRGALNILPDSHFFSFRVEDKEYQSLVDAGRRLGHTPFVIFVASVAIYLSRTCNRSEIVLGVPNLNREGKRFRRTLGMFATIFPLRIKVSSTLPASSLLDSIKASMRSALRHAGFPLSEIGRRLEMIRHGRDGLFDVVLSFERQDYSVSFGGAAVSNSHQLFSGVSRYPIGISVCNFGNNKDVRLAIEGSSAYFSQGDVAMIANRLWFLTRTIADEPESVVEHINVLPPEERWAVVNGFNQSLSPDTAPETFISLFERQVALRPEALALVGDFGSIDYRSLNKHASVLARRLRASGAEADAIVGLAIPRSPEMVIGVLAAAKAGAAFLPIDIDAPINRIRGILADSNAIALLLKEEDWDRFAAISIPRIVVGRETLEASPETSEISNSAALNDLAYVLFTSGSSGNPKGVAVEHRALAKRLGWLTKAFAVDWRDRSAQVTQLTFDPSLIEILLPLINGASIALPPAGRLHPSSLAPFVLSRGVTMMALVPTTLAALLEGSIGKQGLPLRVACCGGEVLDADLAQRFVATTGCRLHNVYGPTEATIFATAWEVEKRATDGSLPIGRPIDDTRIYVLDQSMQPLPFGVVGEIFIGGEALARGYIGLSELTNRVFLPDPFVPHGRIYRTGDRGWIGSDGQLYFAGRIDRQIKIRGYRIELGEIEAVMMKVYSVKAAAAKLIINNNKPVIYAWAAASDPSIYDTVRQKLRDQLPDYMFPSHIEICSILPITPTGKIDYAALIPINNERELKTHRAATTWLERELLELWKAALKTTPIGITDDFFESGGDSMAAVTIIAGIEQRIGKKISLYALTEHPTVERLARTLERDVSPSRVMLSIGNKSIGDFTIFLAASGHGDLIRFQNLSKALGEQYSLQVLQPPERQGDLSIDGLAELYAINIAESGARQVYIAGFSVGGISALATARKLAKYDMDVVGLMLIDTVFPRRVIRSRWFWQSLRWLSTNLHLQDLSMNGRRLEAMFSDTGLLTQIHGLKDYHPMPFDGPTLLVKSNGLAGWDRLLFNPWRKLFARNLREEHIPGLHGSIFEPNSVGNLARLVRNHAKRVPLP